MKINFFLKYVNYDYFFFKIDFFIDLLMLIFLNFVEYFLIWLKIENFIIYDYDWIL